MSRFEPEDLSARPIITGLIVLGLVCIASYFIILWLYTALDRYDSSHQPGTEPSGRGRDTIRAT